MSELFDVVAVNMETHKIRLLAEGKTERNADAIEIMAVGRLGVDTEFFASVRAGKYKDGEEWNESDDE